MTLFWTGFGNPWLLAWRRSGDDNTVIAIFCLSVYITDQSFTVVKWKIISQPAWYNTLLIGKFDQRADFLLKNTNV